MSVKYPAKHGESREPQCDPLACHIPSFVSLLCEQGYAPTSLHGKITIVRNFSRWIEKRKLKIDELDERSIRCFFKEHPRTGHIKRGDRSTLLSLLKWLRDIGMTKKPLPEVDDSQLHRIESDFVQYLVKERGLSKSALCNYLPVIRCFLNETFASDTIVLNEICASNIIQFVLRHARTKSCRCAQLMTSALRGFLRFLHLRGDIDSNLAASVPTVADFRLSELPKSLSTEEIERLLQNCDQSTAIGQRDYAVLLILTRLGLRAAEVVAMTLDDIDWENGVITINGKGSRRDRLPIPQDVGEALATYLRNWRPQCTTRRLFIRARAPHVGFSGSAAICNIVRRALVRSELDPIRKGAHLLRHSLAVKMLQEGARLAEIGEILRHSTPNTTEIYAKVNLSALSALAQPWPGGDV
ncbi:MAG: tyrosine-type recombinase/integrase [Aestuariibacter sp.]|nr:tyrosine-type recombinase/integrase [Aestuariibacter sp.]